MELACAHCGEPLRAARRDARFCSTTCRLRAHRRRVAGLREDAYAEGALRGRVPLARLTRREVAADLETAQPR